MLSIKREHTTGKVFRTNTWHRLVCRFNTAPLSPFKLTWQTTRWATAWSRIARQLFISLSNWTLISIKSPVALQPHRNTRGLAVREHVPGNGRKLRAGSNTHRNYSSLQQMTDYHFVDCFVSEAFEGFHLSRWFQWFVCWATQKNCVSSRIWFAGNSKTAQKRWNLS